MIWLPGLRWSVEKSWDKMLFEIRNFFFYPEMLGSNSSISGEETYLDLTEPVRYSLTPPRELP